MFSWRLVRRSRRGALSDRGEREPVRLGRCARRAGPPWQMKPGICGRPGRAICLAVTHLVDARDRVFARRPAKQHGEQAHEHEKPDQHDHDQQPASGRAADPVPGSNSGGGPLPIGVGSEKNDGTANSPRLPSRPASSVE